MNLYTLNTASILANELKVNFDINCTYINKPSLIKCRTLKDTFKLIKPSVCLFNKNQKFYSLKTKVHDDLNINLIALLINKEYPDDMGSWNFYRAIKLLTEPIMINIKNMRQYRIDIERVLNEIY